MLKKILLVLLLFAASVLGGALSTIVFQPKEACAGCAALPGTGAAVYDCGGDRGYVSYSSYTTPCAGKTNCSNTHTCPLVGYLLSL